MTEEKAIEKHECYECKQGGYCGFDCVLSSTCSTRCPECKTMIYFSGSWDNDILIFACPSCGTACKSPFPYRRKL